MYVLRLYVCVYVCLFGNFVYGADVNIDSRI